MTEAMRTAPSDEGQSLAIGSLPHILWQRRLLVIVPALLIFLAATAAAFLLPRSYRSSAVLLVESPELLATAVGPSENPIDRRMAKIRQQILSRPDLVDLIQTNNLYGVAARKEPLSTLVERMRDATEIAAVDADIQRATPSGGGKGSIAFSLSFDYPQPAQAQIVAQTFVDRLLKLDATSSQNEAQTNVAFLEDQQSGLQSQVDAIEGQVNRLAGVNGAALSSANFALVTGGSTDYATQIAALQRENAQLSAQSGVAVERDPAVTAAEATLAAARAQFSDDHPDVKLAQSRLAAARANARTTQATGISPVVQQQVAANNRAIGELQSQRSGEQGRAAAMAAAQARGPAVAQQVQQLQARADMLRTNLSRVQSNLLTARSMVRLADQQRGERLTLIDPPVTPDRPTSPNRVLLIVGGILGGLAAGLALALLVEMILRPIRSVEQLTGLLGEAPLAVVPVMSRKTPRAKRLRGWRRRPAEAA